MRRPPPLPERTSIGLSQFGNSSVERLNFPPQGRVAGTASRLAKVRIPRIAMSFTVGAIEPIVKNEASSH